MALLKRGKVWHCDFVVDGARYRQSTGKTNWREAQQKERELQADAEQGRLAADTRRKGIARLAFKEAAEQWTADREANICANSAKVERERARSVNRVLGAMKVSAITVEDVLAYVRQRKASGRANATVNRELDVIRGVLKKAKRWHRFAEDVKPLKTTPSIGRALPHGEKLRLLRTAEARPEWQNAYYGALLVFNTTCRGCELRGLQWRDVDMLNPAITIRRSKTDAGLRVIPLNEGAQSVIRQLYARSRKLGEVRPEDYLFFACEHGKLDTSKPITGWRTAWRTLTRLVLCPVCGTQQNPGKACVNEKCAADIEKVKSPLAGLRFHDLRHHAITELAESQASDSTVMAIAGHVSKAMMDHYSHVRLAAKRVALDSISTTEHKGYDTKHDTKREVKREGVPQSVENMVELVGIEPTTSSLRTIQSTKKPQFGVHLAADYGPKRSNSNRFAGSCLTIFAAREALA